MSTDGSDYLTLQEAARCVPGVKPHANTLRRWIVRGVRGLRLRAVHTGRWYTTAEWVREFLEGRTAARLGWPHDAALSERAEIARAAMREKWGIGNG